MQSKTCTKCKKEKIIDLFFKSKNGLYGRRGSCKLCDTELNKLNRANKLKNKLILDLNEKVCLNCNQLLSVNNFHKDKYTNDGFYVRCKSCVKAYYNLNKTVKQEYHRKNKIRIHERHKQYRKLESYKKIRKELNKKYKNNINVKIAKLYRSRIRDVISPRHKFCKSFELLGCSVDFFKNYLESKFTKGMSWENRGLYGWHIDHIIPCSSFDFTKFEDQKKCFHYTNLQPLWATTKIAMSYGEDSSYIGNLEKQDK